MQGAITLLVIQKYLSEINMTLLKVYQHHPYKYIFKFIYNSGYLYTTDVLGNTNSILLGYEEVPKGYKYETIKNI